MDFAALPSQGVEKHPDGSATWRVWAPFARRVDLVLDQGGMALEMAAQEAGWFEVTRARTRPGERYAYRLDHSELLPDPASRWQPDGPHKPSAVFFPDALAWSDHDWRGIARSELVFYEIHVGTFTAAGTFAAVIERLPALCELGVTALEIMPVAQFSGPRGWGYDGVLPFAVQNSYGGPRGLQELVAACHARGLAVFLDVVYNHLGPEGNYLGRFGPYFTEKYRTPWGPALNYDDRGSDVVRQYVLDNVRYWLRDFHFDGLRLDAIHAIVDQSPVHLLRAIQAVADQESARSGRLLHIVAESNLNDVRLLDDPSRGGYGLSAQWSDDFHHAVHVQLTGERNGYYADYSGPEPLVKAVNSTFVFDGQFSTFRGHCYGAPTGDHGGDRFVINLQTHDQVGNRARGERLAALVGRAQLRLAAGLLLMAPYLPLLFMGEEYGEDHPFPFFCSFSDPGLIQAVRRGRRAEFARFAWAGEIPDPQAQETFAAAKLSWSWPADSWQAGLRRWYRDLLATRRREPALRDFHRRRASWHPDPLTPGRGVLELFRGAEAADAHPGLAAYFNFCAHPRPLPATSPVIRPCEAWQVVLSSEWPQYAGARAEASWPLNDGTETLMPFEAVVCLPIRLGT